MPKLSMTEIRYFWNYLRGDKKKLYLCTFILLIIAAIPAITALMPLVLTSSWTVGDDGKPDRLHFLWWGLIGFFLLSLVGTALRFLTSYWTAQISQNFTANVRLAIFEKIGNLPTRSMNAQSIGTLAHRSTGDVMTIQQLLTPELPEAFTDAAQLLFMLVVLFILGPVYAIVVLIAAPLVLFFIRKINLRVQNLAREAQQRSEGIMTQFIEGAAGYRDLVAAGRFHNAANAFGGRLAALKKVSVRTSVLGFSVGLFPFFAFTLLTFAYYFIKTSNADAVGDMTYLGKMMSFAGLLMMIQGPAMGLTNFLTEKALAAPSFIEVHKLLESEGVADVEVGAELSGRSVAVEGVSFSYSPGAPPIIDDATFEIDDGSFTAIVGQTGSGKTTLFYLLLRLLEPQAGVIKLGGVPLSDVRLIDLRNFLGFIPQAPFIFDATIKENLCMGVPEEYDDTEIQRAIELAQLEGLVKKRTSTGGVEAPVGPGGSTLSGGERQRIALGRIFLREPEIIVCDEYTANIDNATARLIQKSLAEVFAGKTRIVITHQLYTVRDADKIIVLDRGRVVGAGTHEELLAQDGGLYREMWEVQRLG